MQASLFTDPRAAKRGRAKTGASASAEAQFTLFDFGVEEPTVTASPGQQAVVPVTAPAPQLPHHSGRPARTGRPAPEGGG
jgi:hypothetical protein